MQDSVLEREALRQHRSLSSIPYRSPLEAAKSLFKDVNYEDLASRVSVDIRESDPPTKTTKRITLAYRDQGCGITPEEAPHTIFALRSTKKDIQWQQGAFGIGGKTTYRNAEAVILVSRRAPELLAPGKEDRIAIAVLEWEFQGKTPTAFYLVTKPWTQAGDDSPIFSVPSSDYPDFKPGTHLALISYEVENIHVMHFGDRRSLYTLLNTRLFEPILPIRVDRPERHPENVRGGLKKKLEDNPGDPPRSMGTDTLPFSTNGHTYHLPVTYHVFSPPDELGARRRAVAPDHVVIFTSNGQTHHQWKQNEFRDKIPSLKHLADRIFVVVETDELPITLRSTLFTADRSAIMHTKDAIRLEGEVASFLRDWDDLKEIHGGLVRKALSSGQNQKSTLNLARELGRAFQGIGFGVGMVSRSEGNRNGTNGKGNAQPNNTAGAETHSGNISPTIDLYSDPTILDGPEKVTAVRGESKFLRFHLNAIDGFIPNRAQLITSSNNEQISTREITVGRLSKGRIRISVAIPEDMPEGEVHLRVHLPQWVKASGGIGGPLEWKTLLNIVAVAPELGTNNNRNQGTGKKEANGHAGGSIEGPITGDMVPLIWKKDPQWGIHTVGVAERLPAQQVASAREEYMELAALGDQLIWVLSLNEEYAPFKKYNALSVRDVSEKTKENRQKRYALGVGTGLLALEVHLQKKRKAEHRKIDDDVVTLAQQSIAAAVLTELKAYDQLAKETGIEETQSQELVTA